MDKKIGINKGLVIGIVFLFIGMSVVQTSANIIEIKNTKNSCLEYSNNPEILLPLIPTQNDGTLSGYVTDTEMNPLEGALVRVHFHETYEEDYTDASGFYHVTNIPICYCLKNATASKEGYVTEWVLLSIAEDTTYDFILTPQNDGTLSGYVTDTEMNPLEGALVRVYFHGTYEEDYTDSSGYYHVTNIPICWCMKNAIASKEGYVTEWILLSIYEDTIYDFILEEEDILCGDVNEDGSVDVSDAVYMINILFNIWPELSLDCRADANGDGMINISDVVYIINYIFIPGFPAPVDYCC